MPFPDENLPVAVVDHRPGWAAEFRALAALLRAAVDDAAIDHVGSTSVPGLAAKDCIDIQVRVAELDEPLLVERFGALGLRRRPEPWNRTEVSAGQRYRKMVFGPPPGARTCNVHVRQTAGGNARYALLFRDFLRADEGARESWGAFKQRLAASVPDLLAYGQIKAPATEVLMNAAERWAAGTGWRVP